MHKKRAFFIITIFFALLISFTNLCAQTNDAKEDVIPNPWSLIIYRPENKGDMNIVRCWVRLEDAETGEDVTYTKAKATYEFVDDNRSRPQFDSSSFTRMFRSTGRNITEYRRTYYVSGGMAMHLNLQRGTYRISVYTPKDDAIYVKTENKGDWGSNVFYYDTQNPTNVIFIYPTTNDNGFYSGGWIISPHA